MNKRTRNSLFGAEFFSSTRRLPAAARRRAVAHRGRADRQEQRRNRKKEPPKPQGHCEDCEHSVPAGSASQPTLICKHKAGAELPWQVVGPDGLCANFEQSREIVPLDIAAALAEGAKLIPLSQGKFTVVDAEDYEELSKYKWSVSINRRTDYAVRSICGKHVRMHRMLLNAPAGLMVDHRDLNGLNNRKSNLRLCTNKENVRNSRPSLGKTSRYKGVYRDKREKKFIARIVVDGKKYCLGYFDDEIEAAIAYDIKAMVFFGEFAYLNFPGLMQGYRRQMTEVRCQRTEFRSQMTDKARPWEATWPLTGKCT